MTPPPRPFRLVYRTFENVEFDPAKSAEVLQLRGFDFAHVARVLPGYVLEREDTRGGYGEPRFRILGEVMGEVLVVVYTPRGQDWRFITAWDAGEWEQELWHERYT